MIVGALLLWFGLALLFTVALCRAASFPIPRQHVGPLAPMEPPGAAGGSVNGELPDKPPAGNASEGPSVNLERRAGGLSLSVVRRLSGYLHSARMTPPAPRFGNARCRGRELDEQHGTADLAKDWVTG